MLLRHQWAQVRTCEQAAVSIDELRTLDVHVEDATHSWLISSSTVFVTLRFATRNFSVISPSFLMGEPAALARLE